MSALSDSELLEGLRAGDAFALEAIFERYEVPLFHFLVGILRNHHHAEDALQETFVKALLESGSVDSTRFKGWLFTVAHRQAMLVLRKQRQYQELCTVSDLLPDRLPSGAEIAENRDDAMRLRSLVERLPHQQRQVLLARIFDGKKYREIAQELGCPLNTALARMHEALMRLRQLWEASHG